MMDFRTEWSSWVLVVLMMIMAYFLNPEWALASPIMFIAQVAGLPLASIAIACIPVIIVCYFIKVIPDIDYSIRVAFVYILYLFIKSLVEA